VCAAVPELRDLRRGVEDRRRVAIAELPVAAVRSLLMMIDAELVERVAAVAAEVVM